MPASTEHVQATKDKPGEVTLSAFYAGRSLSQPLGYAASLSRPAQRYAGTLRREPHPKMLLGKAEKLHEDYFIEFRRDLNELLQFIWEFRPTAQIAKSEGLPKRWEY